MVRRRGPRLTLAEKTELWRRWRRGESLNAIGRALGRIAKVVRYAVARTGGIPPPARQRGRLALSLAEREAISRGLAKLTQAGLEQRDRSVFDRFIRCGVPIAVLLAGGYAQSPDETFMLHVGTARAAEAACAS
jgi:hypothetical protein